MSAEIKHKYSNSITNTVVNLDSTGPQNLLLLILGNTTAAAAKAWVQIFNLPAGSVTLGTTPPTLSIMLPGDGGLVAAIGEGGLLMGGTGLSMACTATRAGSGAANADVNVGWGH